MRFLLSLLFFSFSVLAWEAPELPGEICGAEDCHPEMKKIVEGFETHPFPPQFFPGMYSGSCYYQSQSLDPQHEHFLGLLMDHHPEGAYMAPIFQFFGQGNDMGNWTLEQARSEVRPEWKELGPMVFHKTSATEWVPDREGSPVYVYWVRQNIKTQEIYLISYMRGLGTAICQAFPNEGGLETAPMCLKKGNLSSSL